MYRITKKYNGILGKSKVIEVTNTLKEAIKELDITQSIWRKSDTILVSRKTKRVLICQENEYSPIITWTIEKIG